MCGLATAAGRGLPALPCAPIVIGEWYYRAIAVFVFHCPALPVSVFSRSPAFAFNPFKGALMMRMLIPNHRVQDVDIQQIGHANSARASLSAASLMGWPNLPTV